MRFLAEASVAETFSQNKNKENNQSHNKKEILNFADGDQKIREIFSGLFSIYLKKRNFWLAVTFLSGKLNMGV